jgi:hypothetical protein
MKKKGGRGGKGSQCKYVGTVEKPEVGNQLISLISRKCVHEFIALGLL